MVVSETVIDNIS